MENPRMDLNADDLRAAAAACHDALTPLLDGDWTVPAGDLDWTCRRTLDHVADTLLFYSAQIATRSVERVPSIRNGNLEHSPAQLLCVMEASAAILSEVVRAAPPDARGFHPAGMADPAGFVGMGCTEILIHTDDICRGFGREFRAPEDLSRRVVTRIFPWAPTDGDAWETWRWAAGRISLIDREQLDHNWYWQCAPLSEWDGTPKRRTSPPGWS